MLGDAETCCNFFVDVTVSRFATHAGEPGVIYAANNRGLFRSGDAGRNWKAMDLPWPGPGLADGVAAVACLPE
jgi:hypothetical protein